MTSSELIQGIAAIGGILLGVTYVFGGIVTTIHLIKYGIIEFQLLRSAYLSAGILYLVIFLPGLIFTLILARVLNQSNSESSVLIDVLAIVSLIAGFTFIFIVMGKILRLKTFGQMLTVYVLLSILASLYPAYTYVRLATPARAAGFADSEYLVAIVILFFAQVAQLLYFGVFIHGSIFGIAEVRFSLDPEAGKHFSRMNIPVSKGVAGPFLLIDETETMYILGLKHEDGIQAIKVSKDLVKIVAY